MPTYDYHCEACGHRFEAWQQISDKKLRKCPRCGKPKLQRLVGAGAGLIFRGTGFYVTDYKRKAAPSGESSGGESKPAPPAQDAKGSGAKKGSKA
jgi:putative FmdB family regulatory protein